MDYTRMLKVQRGIHAAIAKEYRKGIQACGRGISWANHNAKDCSLEHESQSQLQSSKDHARNTARHLHLLHAFLKGMEYRRVEDKCYTNPDTWLMAVQLSIYGRPEHLNSKFEDLEKMLEEWFTA